jgi:transposase-like protein
MNTMKEKKKKDAQALFDDALAALQSGKTLEGADGALTPLIKRLIEASLEGEMDAHLDQSRPNRRNGKGVKRVKTSQGIVDIDTPRDRDGSYDPLLLPKRQRTLRIYRRIGHRHGAFHQTLTISIINIVMQSR